MHYYYRLNTRERDSDELKAWKRRVAVLTYGSKHVTGSS